MFGSDLSAARSVPNPVPLADPPLVYPATGQEQFGKRTFQGIPSITRTAKGRLWVAFYGHHTRKGEAFGSFVILKYSDDDGASWVENAYIAFADQGKRTYDPMIAFMPNGEVWTLFAVGGGPKLRDGFYGAWLARLPQPDAARPVWSKAQRLYEYGVPAKPLPWGKGALLPIDYWRNFPPAVPQAAGKLLFDVSLKGPTVKLLSKVPDAGPPAFDESSVVATKDGRLLYMSRTADGQYRAVSGDHGKSWSEPVPYAVLGANANSRAALRPSPSSRLAVAYNASPKRTNITLSLSDDGGDTFPHTILLDDRPNVSYPDIAFGDHGMIYVVYDRGRASAREIILAKVNEDDLVASHPKAIYSLVDKQK